MGKLCECGCGQLAPIAKMTKARLGHVKGQPVRFISGHNGRGKCGADAHGWKGGRYTTDRGYVKILCPDHPRADSGGYVFEHILIGEKALGKFLPEKAVVHHHTPEQPVICQNQGYHMLLHQRTRALRACGHADWRPCKHCHFHDDIKNLRVGAGGGTYHQDCKNLYERERTGGKE